MSMQARLLIALASVMGAGCLPSSAQMISQVPADVLKAADSQKDPINVRQNAPQASGSTGMGDLQGNQTTINAALPAAVQAPQTPASAGGTPAQLPSTFDASGGKQAQTAANDVPPNPQLFGMEIPLLDPASDTMKYNGGYFDLGNNAAVRARFEKYLYQLPDDSTESKRYRKKMNELLKLTQKSARSKAEVGSQTLLQIGRGLYELNDYEGDGGQSGTLAGGIASALSVQYANNSRERKNAKMQAEIDKLVEDTNRMTNHNTGRGRSPRRGIGKQSVVDTSTSNSYKIAYNSSEVTGKKAAQVKNDADSMAATELAKVNYQSMVLSFLFERRFDHALIGANCYRHIFRDGDSQLKLDENSKSYQLFNGIAGTSPTVSALASLAANARHDVDQNIEAVTALLAQNKLADATQHLIEAVAIGEFMQSVATFPAASRRRIAEYWTLRRRVLTALNARDYGVCEETAKRMKELDADFDDSLVMSYCSGRKQQSDLALRNAVKALRAGDDEGFNRYITEAGTIWPRNPKLAEGREQLEKLDSQDGVLEEFRVLYARGDFRTIAAEQNKFEVVAVNPELKQQYKEVLTLISTIDGMLQQLERAAAQDAVMGPCMAYEMLLDQQAQDARYGEDARFRDALNRYALSAHDFVQALEQGKEQAERGELGSALANYYRAQCLYPRSSRAAAGIRELTQRILKAEY